MDIRTIFDRNEAWIAEKLKGDPEYFKELAKGQNPAILYIGCADSRVTAEELMGMGPGEVFVHRNIANVVSNTDLNAMSVIHFAVTQLKVEHIVVCGHYYCGGVLAAMQPDDMGVLNAWLYEIRDVYRLHKQALDAIEDEDARYHRLVELNVQEQCVNVLKLPEVQSAYRNGTLSVHGWVFDIRTGQLIDLGIDFEKIQEGMEEIYRLQ
ncbi:MAG: carbonic anhydrase [Saprospiraceae bacterium]|nr:carbonic anhydrase [Saprospiraceae bacterium]